MHHLDLPFDNPDGRSHQSSGDSLPVTVSQVTAMVKNAIESALPSTISVTGEISNFKRHSSGHLYFTLKDPSSELSCVMWRSQAAQLKFDPTDGMEVIADGRVEVFERAGRYQLYARRLQPRGVGSLELAFRQLCEKLKAEGLFDESHKQALPAFPQRIAIVTSPTGAAIADMIRTISRRFPCVHVLQYPVRVQGDSAKTEIADAIRKINARASDLGGVDLVIVGRGGGSLEDLWAFNEEVVARAIFASRIPVISAVGHETDFTISDMVADVRAATPTAAAELAVPVLDDIVLDLRGMETRLERSIRRIIDMAAAQLAGQCHRRWLAEPVSMVRSREQQVDELTYQMQSSFVARISSVRGRIDRLEHMMRRGAPHVQLGRLGHRVRELQFTLDKALGRRAVECEVRLARAAQRMESVDPGRRLAGDRARLIQLGALLETGMTHRFGISSESLRRREERLAALSYQSILNRGFSITRTKKGSRLVRAPGDVKEGDRLVTQLREGEVQSRVVDDKQMDLFA
ncbi:MAG: exodeoxyribonuclease VII large subunit [Planctomycetota bacterium]|jgi:exodeoxyribonuclease VII large subunit